MALSKRDNMFGFGGEKKKIQRHRVEFEDIRQRVLYRMNPYEQYSFGTVYLALSDELIEVFEEDIVLQKRDWTKLAIQLDLSASRAYRQYSKISGLAGEGGKAGAEGLKLFALEAGARSFESPEAHLLCKDIREFRIFVTDFVTSPDYDNRPLPV